MNNRNINFQMAQILAMGLSHIETTNALRELSAHVRQGQKPHSLGGTARYRRAARKRRQVLAQKARGRG